MRNPTVRRCTIQVDVDGLWVLRRLLGGHAHPADPDMLFDVGLDRIMALFEELELRATFFVVADDLESVHKREVLKRIAQRGHEIASHGMTHRYLACIAPEEQRQEICGSRAKIEELLGVRVQGFKAPGFVSYAKMAYLLEEAGYRYDSSVFGTSLAFIMASYSGIAYPVWRMAFASGMPYRMSSDDLFRRGMSSVEELPVSVMPLTHFPMHFSYLMLGGRVYAEMIKLSLCAFAPAYINYLFHPLDFVDDIDVRTEKKIAGLSIASDKKLLMAREMLTFLKARYAVMTSSQLCADIGEKGFR